MADKKRERGGLRGPIKGSFTRREQKNKQKIPISLERALLLAGEDEELCASLIGQGEAALGERGFFLRPHEKAILAAMPASALRSTVQRLHPKKQRNKAFAAAVAATAAGTMLFSSCYGDSRSRGIDPSYTERLRDAGADASVDGGDEDIE